jgi:DNA-binding transcriptional regulator YiaG
MLASTFLAGVIATAPSSYVCQAPMEKIIESYYSSSTGLGEYFLEFEKATLPSPFKQKPRRIIYIDDQPLSITRNALPIEQPKDTIAAQTNISIDRLNLIRERFALSITQMAELFGVTRKSIYDWYEGVEPRAAMTSRMEILIDALGAVPDVVDLQRLKVVWNIPVSGQSFCTVFNNANLDNDSLLKELKIKLRELSPRMVKKTSLPRKTTTQLGEAHLAEFDRHADFS